MDAKKLVLEVLSVAEYVHPNYTHEQKLSWALGFLAKYVLRKNHMDNKVFYELNTELNYLLETNKYI